MHASGLNSIAVAKKNDSWTSLDNVEKGVIPTDLKAEFDKNPTALANFQNFTRGQRKSYLYWLNQAKREETKQKRVAEIVRCCSENIKSRGGWGS